VSEEKTLKTLSFFDGGVDHVHDLINDFFTFRVVSASPIVRSSRDFSDDASLVKELGHVAILNAMNHARFEVHQDGSRDILAITHLVEEDFQTGVGSQCG
jgi:hypothetical protein